MQEEPGNQGAWPFLGLVLPEKLPRLVGMKRVTRRAMAAPAVGSSKVHEVEQRRSSSPIGVPGPTRVSRSFFSALSMAAP